MNGWVTIGTKLDTKQLEKDIKNAENQLKQYEREGERLSTQKAKLDLDLQDYEKEKQSIQEATDKSLEFAQTREQVNFLLESEEMQLSKLNEKYSGQFSKLSSIKSEIQENKKNQQDTTKAIEEQKKKLAEANEEIRRSQFLKNGYEDTKKNLSDIVKKVTRWGLALIGVRSLYSGLRQAISMVSGQNEQVANSFQQIRSVIASTLLPIVQKALNIIVKLMVYANYLWKILTGKNLFNFADATKKASDNLSSGAGSSGKIAKNLKDAKKQLAGFDEMNVLQENADTSGGGGGGAGGLGDTDFENIFDKLKNVKIPKWLVKLGEILKELKKYWKELLVVVVAFGTALLAVKIGTFIAGLMGIQALSAGVIASIALIAAGVVLLVGGLANLILNWDTMTQKEKIISGALAGIGAAFVALGVSIALGISAATLGIGALIALVIALVTAIATLTIKHEKEVKAARDETEQTKQLKQAKEDAKKAYDDLIDAVDRQAEAQKHLQDVEKESGLSGEALYKQVENGTLTYQQMNDKQREVYKAYKDLVQANADVKKAEETKMQTDSLVIKKEFDKKIAADTTGKSYGQLKKDIIDAWDKGKISTKDAKDSIERMMGSMDDKSKKVFAEDLPKNIKSGLDKDKYTSTLDKLKNAFSNAFRSIRDKANGFLDGIKKTFNVEANVSAKTKSAKGAIVTYPKLAVGGIVNRPGRGVPVGGAIAGERGAEGVIPLTDSQQMALLGEAIGKYITVNANIVNTMNGRVISRELKTIQNEDNFAFNR